MSQHCISELKPGIQGKILEAKVYRTWTVQKSNKPLPIDFCCILIDRESNAIQASMGKIDIPYFKSTIQTGSTYRISNFMCVPTPKYSQTLSNNTSLKFGRYTKFDIIPDEGFPIHHFNFISYNQLGSKIRAKNANTNDPYPGLTDYIGCLTRVGNVDTFGSAARNVTIVRKMDIENLKQFDKDAFENLPPPVIIAVSSCKVSEYAGTIQLLATYATHCYLNPEIPALTELLPQFHAKYTQEPLLPVQKTKRDDPTKQKMANKYPLSTLLRQNPERYKWIRFTNTATITEIHTNRGWYYESCTQCARKVEKDFGTPYCPSHGPQANITYRYNFKILISDNSGTATLTCFTPNAKSLTGYDCPDLVTKHGKPGPHDFPEEIMNIKNRTYIFQFHFNPSCESGKVDFYFDDILEMNHQASIDTGNISRFDLPGASEISVDQELISDAELEEMSTRHPFLNTPSTPATAVTEMTPEIQTPDYITATLGVQKMPEPDNKDETRNVKRALFSTASEDAKKTKQA